MTTTEEQSDATAAEAKPEKDVLGQLADRGEKALSKLTELPGGSRAAKAFNDLRERVDELGKKVRGVDELEARVAKLEAEVAELRAASHPDAPA